MIKFRIFELNIISNSQVISIVAFLLLSVVFIIMSIGMIAAGASMSAMSSTQSVRCACHLILRNWPPNIRIFLC